MAAPEHGRHQVGMGFGPAPHREEGHPGAALGKGIQHGRQVLLAPGHVDQEGDGLLAAVAVVDGLGGEIVQVLSWREGPEGQADPDAPGGAENGLQAAGDVQGQAGGAGNARPVGRIQPGILGRHGPCRARPASQDSTCCRGQPPTATGPTHTSGATRAGKPSPRPLHGSSRKGDQPALPSAMAAAMSRIHPAAHRHRRAPADPRRPRPPAAIGHAPLDGRPVVRPATGGPAARTGRHRCGPVPPLNPVAESGGGTHPPDHLAGPAGPVGRWIRALPPGPGRPLSSRPLRAYGPGAPSMNGIRAVTLPAADVSKPPRAANWRRTQASPRLPRRACTAGSSRVERRKTRS